MKKADEKVFECDECKYKSSSEHGMKIHKTKKHVQRCQYCNQIFPNAVEKSNHLVGCDAMTAYYSPFRSPGPSRGNFPPRFPPRFPNRFPHGPLW